MTQISYHRNQLQLAISSYVSFASVSNLNFQTEDMNFSKSKGRFRNIAITPTIKYITKKTYFKNYHFFLGAGPLWSQRTIKLSSSQTDKEINLKAHKVNYESRGAIIQLGLEQPKSEALAHPLYFELAFIFSESRKAFLINTEDFRKTEILSRTSAVSDVKNFKVFFSVMMTMF